MSTKQTVMILKYTQVKSSIQQIILLICFLLMTNFLRAEEDIFKGIKPSETQEYIIRMKNGDLLTGTIVEMVSSPEDGDGIKFKTELGKATIYGFQIQEIRLKEENYRHSHKLFFLPTAEAIKDNYYISISELVLVNAGVGISDYFSITASRTLIPYINSDEQLTMFNAKATVLDMPFESTNGKMTVAVGVNYASLNDANKFYHFYGLATFRGDRSIFTTGIFYKNGSESFYTVKAKNEKFKVRYDDGSFGIALGLDTKFSNWHDIHFIGELWNSDISKPTNTGVLLGVRLSNTRFSADFGLAFFTQPLIAPFANFAWTPF